MSLVTRFGADPTLDTELANKRYADSTGGGATVTSQSLILVGTFTTTSTSNVDITGFLITVANRSGGNFMLVACGNVSNSTTGGSNRWILEDDGTDIITMTTASLPASDRVGLSLTNAQDLDGRVEQMRARVISGTGSWFGGATFSECNMAVIEIS